ncbi:MAG TPA: biotin/lipoyl-binding protein, partial [Jatrophihabitantaceae bacterium]
MADLPMRSSRQRARRRRRRRAVVLALAAAVVLGGAGTAWAMTRSSGPQYRLARVQRSDIEQTVDADGTVATVRQASVAFATTGTVQGVLVRNGDTVRAGQVVARLDRTELANAVVSAKQTLAAAKQKLASDESTQTSNASTTAATTGSRSAIVLTAAVGTAAATGNPLVQAVVQAQRTLVRGQHRLDTAISTEDDAIDAATTACAETDDTSAVAVSTTADSTGSVHGTVGGEAVTATLLDADGSTDHTTTSSNPQAVAAGGSYRFSGLTAGDAYQVSVVRSGKAIDTAACTSALTAVQSRRAAVDTSTGTVDSDMTSLTNSITALQHGAGSPTGAPSSGSTSSSGPSTRPTQQPSQQPTQQPSRQPSQRPSGGSSSVAVQPSGRVSASGSPSTGTGTTNSGAANSGAANSGAANSAGTTEITAQQ